jgi:endonuclease-3
MATPSRTAQFTRLYRLLKKYYTPVAPDAKRSVLEQLLFASCLENAHYTVAEEAFAALVHSFFDWNEIRVSSVRELSEVMSGLPDPPAAAHRVKRILQNVFEATYAFDLEGLRRQNLGPAIERLEKIEGTTKFSIAYLVQSALGGHLIPVDSGTLGALRVVELVSDEDVAAGVVPGLERAISKQSGTEFGSLVHQLGADFVACPYAPQLRAILLEIEPKATDRLPTRRSAKRAVPEPAPAAAKPGPEAKAAKPAPEAGKEAAEAKAAPTAKEAPPATKKKPPAAKKKTAPEAQAAEAKPPAEPPRKKEAPEAQPEPEAAKKKAGEKPKKPAGKKKPEGGKEKPDPPPADEASAAEGLSKRKPR